MKFFIKIFFSASLIISCNQVSSKYVDQINNPEILLNEISEHIKYLSADEREGRFPGTKGSQEAINYIVDELKGSGVSPAVDDEYLQYFNFSFWSIYLTSLRRLFTAWSSPLLFSPLS